MMKKFFVFCALLFVCCCVSAQQSFRGQLLGERGEPLTGGTAQIRGKAIGANSDSEGYFTLLLPAGKTVLEFSFQGYQTKVLEVQSPFEKTMAIQLSPNIEALAEVRVNSGYQDLSRAQTTGSYSSVNQALLERRVSTDVLSKIEHMVPGLIFNRGKASSGSNDISIRGQSTISASAKPLIVLDNFPYEGDLANINPNDIESVVVLKDAAAAAIWGARAGNGVIVLNSKKGGYGQQPKVTLNSNVTFGNRPDLFYFCRISSSEYIELEKLLFEKQYYAAQESSLGRGALSPVVELLISKRDRPEKAAWVDAEIERLKQYDIRNDYERLLYRESVNQQHALSIAGGTAQQRYFLSAGLDQNLESLRNNSFSRISINGSNSYHLLANRLEISSAVSYTGNKVVKNNAGTGGITSGGNLIYPYARLADENGTPLAIAREYREGFIAQAAQQGLLDWSYKPLEEISFADNTTNSAAYRVNTQVKFKLSEQLRASLLYQFSSQRTDFRNNQTEDSYYTRNQINRLTIVNPNGTLERPVPLGSILDLSKNDQLSNNGRFQLDYSNQWNGKHGLSVMMGAELQAMNSKTNAYRYYGYNEQNSTSKPVDYLKNYVSFVNPNSKNNLIINNDGLSELNDRSRSYYTTMAYDFLGRYVLTASARLDQSNLFGVKANQKGVPLWSTGLAWHINKEAGYGLRWLPVLKLRASYGYNGNVNKNVSAYTTARLAFSPSALTQLTYANIINPPNPELRWERIKIINVGLDFGLKGGRLSGSVELYSKDGLDLIGTTPFPSSTGIRSFTGNTANTRGKGLDVSLNSINTSGELKWVTDFNFSYVADKVTAFGVTAPVDSYLQFGDGGGGSYPLMGKPLYAVYSFKWGGLDPLTGDPMGYKDGLLSKNWTEIIAATNPSNMIYHGSTRPVYFGSLRNTLSFKNISLSANITYKLGYYFRSNSVIYNNNMGLINGHGDYQNRWNRAGDEAFTHVPAIPAVVNANRDKFYTFSEVLVHRGDHIRLQDINLSYQLSKANYRKLPFSQVQFYLYVNNMGILWKATDLALDPDYAIYSPPPARTAAFGIQVTF